MIPGVPSPFLADTRPYALVPPRKKAHLLESLIQVQEFHAVRCGPYGRLLSEWRRRCPSPSEVSDLPYLPVTVFKDGVLRSASDDAMQLNSSATTSDRSSMVFADRETRIRQTTSANAILRDFVGYERRPYLVFDVEATVRGGAAMSARGAAILGLAHLSSEIYFVMRQEGERIRIDRAALRRAIDAVSGRPFLAYGFTHVLYSAHQELREDGPWSWTAHPGSYVLHSGGWKRLQAIAVDKSRFNAIIGGVWGLADRNVIDFYGVIEQAGIPYPDCEEGLKHPPYWADVVIRASDSLDPVDEGGMGLIQLMNCLPLGGPNHSVLTEDLGELVVRDGCRCGRRGVGFRFMGRAPRAEIRGCSDVAQRG
ncbi:MAG: acyl-protein synthetase [Planctomycetes bacterium]|nr:acyl-protein synthetase [Planctomycetota bacterium]